MDTRKFKERRSVSEAVESAEPAKPASSPPTKPLGVAVPLLFVALPAILFYGILVCNISTIPYDDDYFTLLGFLNQLVPLQSISAKVMYFLAAQHNEYKLFFVHAVAWSQYALFGHLDLRVLALFGDLFILLLAILFWKMFLPRHNSLPARLAYFIPVSWLLFQLQYWETANWAMASLQNTPVLFFSFGAIYLLVKGSQPAFWGALTFFILAVAASGNGFLLVPVALLFLVLNRRYIRIVLWLVATAACIAAYAYRYNVMSSQTQQHHSIFSTFHPLAPAYVIAFIGSAAGFPFKPASLFLGSLLCIFFIWMAWRGYIRRNPLVSYCVLFLLLTSIGVAGLRSDFGLAQALSSRYTIYSDLFLIFAWFAIVEEFLQHKRIPFLSNNLFLAAVALSVLYGLSLDMFGMIQISSRTRNLVQAMAAYQHPTSPDSIIGPSPKLLDRTPDPLTDDVNQRARPILAQSIKLGIYRPPD
jgi:hypothetical protein